MEELTSELWRATMNSEYDKANQLICSGANVNEPRDTGFDPMTTLLHHATRKKNVQLMRLLIEHGANYNAQDSRGRTPLHWAAMFDDRPDVVEVLIDAGATVDPQIDTKMTPFLMAVQNSYYQSAEMLLARGASIDAVDAIHGWSALHYTSTFGDLRMMKLLISQKINIDAQDDARQYTPLHHAVLLGKTDKVYLLLDNGADPNKRGIGGDLPLTLSAYKNNTAIVGRLLKQGARINEVTDTGNTALHEAIKYTSEGVVALLVKFGADMNVPNHEGKTALQLLVPTKPSIKAIAKILIQEAVKREALGQPIYEGYRQMAQSCEEYAKFDQECREEIKRMRSQTIDVEDSGVSFFYIFSNNQEKLAVLARNKNIVAAFETSPNLALLRIYADDLITNFETAKRRADFLMAVEDGLVDGLGDILPELVLKKIAAYVKYVDI